MGDKDDPKSLHVIGVRCYVRTNKSELQAILTANGIPFKKSEKVPALVDAIHENGLLDPALSKLRGYVGPCLPYEFTVRGCAYRHTSVTEADHTQALKEIKESLNDEEKRKANTTHVDTYTPTLDDDGNPIPGMKTHRLTGVKYIQGLVTCRNVVKEYDGSPVANVYGDGMEARKAKKRTLSDGVTTAKNVIRAAIGLDNWRTLPVTRIVCMSGEGHKVGNPYVENPNATNNPTESSW
jgi:hypothetical protein